MDDSPPSEGTRRPLVVTVGGSGEIVAAVKRHLRDSYELREVYQGDDVAQAVNGAHAVVVLEAASVAPNLTRYQQALAAVAHGLSASAPTVVSVRDQGVHLLALRCCSVIGTPRERGPSDEFIIAREAKGLRVRGNGDQRWTPIRLDDLALIVSVATEVRRRHGTYEVGGPETTVLGLIEAINPRHVKVRHVGRFRWWLHPADLHLPDTHLVAGESTETPRPLGVEPRKVESAWPPDAVARKRSEGTTKVQAFLYRTHRLSPVVAVFLTLVAAGCVYVGGTDLSGPAELSVRVTAALLLLAALVMGLGALALFRPWGDLLAFLATVVAALVLLLLALTTTSQPISPPGVGVVAWAGFAVAVGFAAGLWKLGGLEFARVVASGAPRTITSIIGVGTVVGFGQFWYQNVYLPSVAHPTVNLSANLEMGEGFARHRRVVYGTLKVTNPTEREVTILASHFEVLGRRLEKRLKGPQPAGRVLVGRDRPAGRQVRTGPRTVLRSGEISGTGSFLVPGEETTRRVAISVPRRHRVVEVNGYIIVARDRLSPEELTPALQVPHHDTRSVHRSYDIVEDSAWRKLTRGHRALYTMETLGAGSVGYWCQGYAQVQAYIDGVDMHPRSLPGRFCTQDSRDLAQFYGVTQTSAVSELLLPYIEP